MQTQNLENYINQEIKEYKHRIDAEKDYQRTTPYETDVYMGYLTAKIQEIHELKNELETLKDENLFLKDENQLLKESIEEELEETENHECEYTRYHIEELLRANDGAQEQNHAHLLNHLGEPQPICPWCKQTAGIVYRENRQYLLRCPCRVIYVQANSPAAAAKQLQLPGKNQ